MFLDRNKQNTFQHSSSPLHAWKLSATKIDVSQFPQNQSETTLKTALLFFWEISLLGSLMCKRDFQRKKISHRQQQRPTYWNSNSIQILWITTVSHEFPSLKSHSIIIMHMIFPVECNFTQYKLLFCIFKKYAPCSLIRKFVAFQSI